MMIDKLFAEGPWPLLLAQGTACLAVGLAAGYALRHRPARAHQALLTAMLASVLMPGLYLSTRHLGLGVLAPRTTSSRSTPALRRASVPTRQETSRGDARPAAGDNRAADTPLLADLATTEMASEPAPPPIAEPVAEVPAYQAMARCVPWDIVAAVCWMAATMVLATRLVLRFILGMHIVHTAPSFESDRFCRAVEAAKHKLGIGGPIQVRCSESVHSPVIWCWSAEPVLLVHEKASRADSRTDWVSVFCHELSHWKRLDHVSGLVAEVLTAMFPWHPLLWWAKGRLLRLSEQVCDDWVLASGQTGVDYAESLLDLSPERQTAFIPTIIGKEKAMKERICRIVKDGCGDPRIGIQWAIGVGALAMLASVGVAFAQEQPETKQRREGEQRPDVRQEQAAQRPAVTGRRNVLTRLRDQLQEQARNTEAAIRQRGDDTGPESHVLHAELDALHEQIGLVEQQLRDLEGRPRRAGQAEPRPPELEARFNELMRHREELAENARRMERELGELRDDQRPQAGELKAQLERLRAQMSDADRQLAEFQRAQAGVRTAGPRPPQPQAQPENLRQRRAALAEESRLVEQRLKELRPDQSQEARELQARLHALRAQTAQLDNRPEGLPRMQGQVERAGAAAEPRPRIAPAENPRLEAQIEELRNQMRELREQMQQMQRLMEPVGARGQTRERAGEQP